MKKILFMFAFIAMVAGCSNGHSSGSPDYGHRTIPEKLGFKVPPEAMNAKLTDKEFEDFRAVVNVDKTTSLDLSPLFEQIFVSKYESPDDKDQRDQQWTKENQPTKDLLTLYTNEVAAGQCSPVVSEPPPTDLSDPKVGSTASSSYDGKLDGNDCSLHGTLKKNQTSVVTKVDSKSMDLNFTASIGSEYAYSKAINPEDMNHIVTEINANGPISFGNNSISALVNMDMSMIGSEVSGRNVNLGCKMTILSSANSEDTIYCQTKVSDLNPIYYISIHADKNGEGEYWLNDRHFTKAEWDQEFPGWSMTNLIKN